MMDIQMDLVIPEPRGTAPSLPSIELWWSTVLLISIAPTIIWEHWDTEGVEGHVALLHGISPGSQKEVDQNPTQRCYLGRREGRQKRKKIQSETEF